MTSPRTILITGASRGIGQALARAFHERGDKILLVARSESRLNALAEELPGAVALPCQLTEPSAVAQLVHEVERHHSDLSILINNAGRQYRGRIDEDPDFLDASIADLRLNLEAPLRLTSLLLPTLTQHSKGEAAVINVTSALAYAPKQSAPAYCASKAGLHSLTTALRWQLEPLSVRVVEVAPPLVQTDMAENTGKSHASPADVAAQIVARFERGEDHIRIGQASLLYAIQRISPGLARRVVRHS